MSNIIHKVKDAVTGHKDHENTSTTTTGTSNPNYYSGGSTNAGPHNSNVANKVDPRVDSDMDGSRTAGNYNSGNTGITGTGAGMHSNTHSTGMHSNTHSTGGHGPHNSGIANRADPRVDSTTGTANTGHSTNYGPHDSNMGNKLDPRVDSDHDGSRTMGNTGNTGMGMGTHSGTHSGNYDSYTSTGNHSGTHSGTGMMGSSNRNTNTAGPHNSNLMNKLDPRVDSDLDGSRTVGQGPQYGNH